MRPARAPRPWAWAAYLAIVAALALVVAHLIVNGPMLWASSSTVNWSLRLAWVAIPCLLGIGSALVAAAMALPLRIGPSPRALRILAWVAAVLLGLIALSTLAGSVMQRAPTILLPNGPGPYSLVGAIAFALTAWSYRPRPATQASSR
jgi:hypothetical protein